MNFLKQSAPAPPPIIKVNGPVPTRTESEITSNLELITPELAKAYLAFRNDQNRPISKAATIRHARDMKEGRWSVTGQGIIFDKTGKLVDGHHRLTAAVDHGVSFMSLVIRGVAADAITDIDGGRSRTAADMAHMNGVADATTMCSIMGIILVHERWGVKHMKEMDKAATKAEIVDALKVYPDIEICASRGRSAHKHKLMSKKAGGFCYWAFRKQNREMADKFWEELITGANLARGSAVLHLRRALLENASSKTKMRTEYVIALTFKAWQAYRDRKTVRKLEWRGEGAAAEPFPEI